MLAAPSLEFDRVRRLPSPNTELLNHELMRLYTARAWTNGQTWRLV
ncbi:MAG: hypothetical protein K8H99_02835 [Nitrospirae bacterium]|nr:hypothetical protein [Fimbriimonadaceae bacterium]